MTDMIYTKFVRKPFIVDAVEVTLDNIEEIAKWVGELREEKGKPYILVNRNVVPGVTRVHPGYWMTRLGDNIRCYNKRVFASQFGENTPEIENWVNYIRNDAHVNVDGDDVVDPGSPDQAEEVPQPETRVEVVVNGGNTG